MSTHTQTITAVERAPFGSVQVNREAGYIDGVLICGFESLHKRDYPANTLRRDFAKYEGAAVNCDHKDEATVDRRLGWFTGVKPGDDGRPRGRLNVLKSHPMAERVFEAAERNPALFGMSHVAVCKTKKVNGRETVESIDRVLSIDLVATPATTKSLYESQGNPMDEQEKADLTAKLAESAGRVTALEAELTTLREQVKTLTAENTRLAIESLFAEAKVKPTDVQRKAVAALPDDADRKALVESFKLASQGQKPTSGEQNAVKTTTESVTVPTDGKAFAEFIR